MAQNKMKTFKSENGFYKLEYPENFSSKYDDNILNIFPSDNKSSCKLPLKQNYLKV